MVVGFAEELGDSTWAYYQDADRVTIAAKARGFVAVNEGNLGEDRFLNYNTEINSLGENLKEATPPGTPVDSFREEVEALAGHYLVSDFGMTASKAVDKATDTLLGKNQFLVQVGGRAAIISDRVKHQYKLAGFLEGGANAGALEEAIQKFNRDPRINERRLQRAGTTEEDDLVFQNNRYWEIVEVSEGVVKAFFYEHSGNHEYESVLVTQNINGIATPVPLSMDLQELYTSYRADQKYPEDALETSGSGPSPLPRWGRHEPTIERWGKLHDSFGDINIPQVDVGPPLKFPRGTNGSHLTSSIAESIYLAAGGDNGVKAMSMRVKGRDNGDGTISSHLMASTGPDDPRGNYAFPTLFPKDPKNQTNNPEDWIELNEDEAFEEAKKRGELMKFDSFDEVDKFAQGSWKGGREWEKSMRPKQEFNKDNGFKVLVSTNVDGKMVYSNKFLAKRFSALEESIIAEEGLRLNDKGEHVAYRDSEGVLTVGHGHRVLPEDNIVEGQAVSDDVVEALFAKDMSSVRKEGSRITRNYNRLPLEAKDVIMQMIFQLGPTGTKEFTKMIKALNSNPPDLIEASKEMLLSEWATQTPERAKKLSEAMKQASTYLRPLGAL
jgi:lysozyme